MGVNVLYKPRDCDMLGPRKTNFLSCVSSDQFPWFKYIGSTWYMFGMWVVLQIGWKIWILVAGNISDILADWITQFGLNDPIAVVANMLNPLFRPPEPQATSRLICRQVWLGAWIFDSNIIFRDKISKLGY